MIYDVTGTVNFSQVQVYNNELINYVIINRGFSRLYDNDVAIVAFLSGKIDDDIGAISDDIISLQNDVGNVEVDITTLQSNVATLSANTTNYILWNSTYTTVNTNYTNWNTTYSVVAANSAAWTATGSGSGGLSALSSMLDVNVGTLDVSKDGFSLTWNNTAGEWQPIDVASSGGASTAAVSAIVNAYDTANYWTITGSDWATNSGDILGTATFITTTSSDIALKTDENGYTWNTFWVDNGEGVNSASTLARSFYSPIQTAEYALLSGDIFDTSTSGHNLKQIGVVQVRRSIDNTVADLANETLTINGTADGGTDTSLYLTMQYKSAMDATFNMPDEDMHHLMRISGCTFGFSNIAEANSNTTFDGFYIRDCIFAGDVGQKFFFKNCYVELDTFTISNACEFHFDNSCTVDASVFGTDGVLTLKNKGIPTYSTNGTDPSTISGSFAGFTGPYLYSDTLVQP